MGDLSHHASTIIESWVELAAGYAPRLALALLTLLLGLWLIRLSARIAERALLRTHLEPTLSGFLLSLGSILLKVLLFVSVASTLGVATTSLVAIIGAAGIALGLALQGSLANFAAGILVLLFKPFRVGDVIEAQGRTGRVQAIYMFQTELITGDNQRVIIPNGKLYSDVVVNVTHQRTRRAEVVVGVAYDSHIPEVRRVLLESIRGIPGLLSDPAPRAEPRAFAESAIEFVVRAWCATADHGEVLFAMHERIKGGLDAANIEIPFPQRDVHVKSGPSGGLKTLA